MDEEYFDRRGLNDEIPEVISIDKLLAETKEQIDQEPGAYIRKTERQIKEESDFAPDFGNAFDDYGDYSEEEEYEEEPQKPKRRVKIIPFYLKLIFYVLVVGLCGLGVGLGGWMYAEDVLAFGRAAIPVSVVVNDSDTYVEISEMLGEKGIIKYPWLFQKYCEFTGSTEKMCPGTYTLSYHYDYHALVSGMKETSPNRLTVRVMIPEGRTCAQIFKLMEDNSVCSVKELQKAAAGTEFDYWFLEGIPYGDPNRLEGFLFPDTYDFYENDSPDRVLEKMLTNFRRKFSDEAQEQLVALNELLEERWLDAGLGEDYVEEHAFTVRDVVNVAAMIEKETAGNSESTYIASVIYNRLCAPAYYPFLNIDATVVYALGGVDHALSYEDTQVYSPYNTYVIQGLPAGPIANPGLSSITAALNPVESTYHYYALDKSTGYHHFSETFEEHNEFLEEQANAD